MTVEASLRSWRGGRRLQTRSNRGKNCEKHRQASAGSSTKNATGGVAPAKTMKAEWWWFGGFGGEARSVPRAVNLRFRRWSSAIAGELTARVRDIAEGAAIASGGSESGATFAVGMECGGGDGSGWSRLFVQSGALSASQGPF